MSSTLSAVPQHPITMEKVGRLRIVKVVIGDCQELVEEACRQDIAFVALQNVLRGEKWHLFFREDRMAKPGVFKGQFRSAVQDRFGINVEDADHSFFGQPLPSVVVKANGLLVLPVENADLLQYFRVKLLH